MNKIAGISLCLAIALVALFLSKYFPIGSIAIAILLGALIGNTISIPENFNAGITFSEKTLLAAAIALLGVHLDFNVLTELGFETIGTIVFALLSVILFTFYLARKYNFEKKFALILGLGNGICGSAAIAATKDIVKLEKEKSAIAIAAVNLLGTIGLLILPIIGVLLGFSDVEIGILLGNTLQSVGHAVAAGFGVNETVGQSATIVKMGRILLLTPVIIWLIYWVSKNGLSSEKQSSKLEIPHFLIGFVIFSILATSGVLPQTVLDGCAFLCKVALLLAMSAIGLKISFKAIKESGWDALVLAGYIFKFQIILSVILIAIL